MYRYAAAKFEHDSEQGQFECAGYRMGTDHEFAPCSPPTKTFSALPSLHLIMPWQLGEQQTVDLGANTAWQKSVKRRLASINRERRRNQAINLAFHKLQLAIPHMPSNKSVAKIRTLRLAIRYIQYLQEQLAVDVQGEKPNTGDDGRKATETESEAEADADMPDFRSIAKLELSRKNSYAFQARHCWTPASVKNKFY